MDDSDYAIRLYCDAPNAEHPKKHPRPYLFEFVTDVRRRPGEWWVRHLPRRYQGRGVADIIILTEDDRLYNEVYDSSRRNPGVATRSDWSPSCPHCRKPYPLRLEKLCAALELARHAGVSELTLAELSGIVQNMARDR